MKDPFGSSLFVFSSNVEIRPLQRAFHKTTASYKFLWFLAILDLVKEAPQDAGPLRLSISMICPGWLRNLGFRHRDLSCLSVDGTKLQSLSKH